MAIAAASLDKEAVGASEHGILLVQDGRDPHAARREQGGNGRIAAEADDRIGPSLLVQHPRLAPSGEKRTHAANQAERALRQPAGRKDVHGNALEEAGETCAAVVGDQQHAMSALPQFRRERVRGDHVAPGASCGQNEVHAVTLSPLHFTTYGERLRYGFRLVNASSKPMPIDRASMDDPP